MCQDCDFVHLHLHTEYSLLDGFARIEKAVAHAQKLGMTALGITDHGTMFGVIDFYRACTKAGIKPIIGVEAYLAHQKMSDHNAQERKPYHMLLLAQNEVGYKNLLHLSSEAQLRGFYQRPRIDRELMYDCREGLIATSGCLAAEIPRTFEQGDEAEARRLIGEYQDIFGKDNFFLELQPHDLPELKQLNPWLIKMSKELEVPLLATNDVHYVDASDYNAHDVLLCIQTSALQHETNRMRMGINSYYMRSQAEMYEAFGEVEGALQNSVLIAERCEDLKLSKQTYHLPVFPVPSEFENAAAYLEALCYQGLKWRYGEDVVKYDPKYEARLKHELGIINRMGFATYFLIVWDLCEFARSADIWWNVRGSGAGSVVAYTLGITSLDPLENALIFERFLNPGRVSMPDFDLDFPEDRRMEMIDYCCRKYGEDKVAAIITFGTLGAKGAIKDVGRVLNVDLREVTSITGLIPTDPALPPLKDLVGEDDEKAIRELRELYENNAKAREIIDLAIAVEGVPRHASTHAAGIIVADRPLVDYIPLHRPTKGDAEDSPVKMVTQFPMETAESIGLLKIDFLGLSTLTILRRACELIEKHHGIQFDMSNIPYKPDPDDPEITRKVQETFKMIGEGKTIGVFQVESSGMRQMLTGMRPQTFEHIIAAISLYRPGPMDYIPTFNRRLHGEEEVIYHHPKLIPILENTYAILVYQEQIMQVAAELFGYSLGEADMMRRAVSKKKEKDLLEHRQIFLERGPEHGIDPEAANRIFDDIVFFARYGFNKSHAADYAVITCQTAYLKCHYPHEYMTALMSVYYDDSAKVRQFIQDCRQMRPHKIDVLPPDVNYSVDDFAIEYNEQYGKSIRFGLGAIKNVGHASIEHIIQQRGDEPFASLDDFLKRCQMKEVGKRALESLIKVGALDSFGVDRALLLANLEPLMNFSSDHHKNLATGQVNMFDMMGGGSAQSAHSVLTMLQITPPAGWDKREQLRWEKELVGLYVSQAHPVSDIWAQVSQKLRLQGTFELQENVEQWLKKGVRVLGLVTDIRRLSTKNGDDMAIITVEDVESSIEMVLFPKAFKEFNSLLSIDHIYLFMGELDQRGNDLQVILKDVKINFEASFAQETPLLADEAPSFMPDVPEDLEQEAADQAIRNRVAAAKLQALPTTNITQSHDYAFESSVTHHQLAERSHLPQIRTRSASNSAADEAIIELAQAIARPRQNGESSDTLKQHLVRKYEDNPPASISKLIVKFKLSPDQARNRRVLDFLGHLAKEYPGHDQMVLRYQSFEGQWYQMEFPNSPVLLSPDLLDKLTKMEGVSYNIVPMEAKIG